MIESVISKEHIEHRIEDWIDRISRLYESIREWLRPFPSYEIKERNDVRMYEELMQQYSIPERIIPSLDIYQKGQIIATIKPVGLWIIGANGRIDILLNNGAIMLIDVSDRFKDPTWIAHKRPNIAKGETFNKDYFLNLLGIC